MPAAITLRPLKPEDAPAFARLEARMPLRFLTPRLNVESYGLGNGALPFYGAFFGAELRGLLFRFGNTVVTVDGEGECGERFAAAVDVERNVAGLRGASETLEAARAHLRRYQPTDQEESPFLRLLDPPRCPVGTLRLARRAAPDDLDGLAALYSGAGTMFRSRANVAEKLQGSRVFVAETGAQGRRPRIVSCALLNVEGSDAGLIGGVFTAHEARGKGYAAACTAALSLDLQRDGKLPCLFYENSAAGRVYRRLGFTDADRWAVLYLAPNRAQSHR